MATSRLYIPTRNKPDSDDFVWTVFKNRYAHAKKLETPAPNEHFVGHGFKSYVDQHLVWGPLVLAKERRPGIIHGLTDGYRGNVHTFSCTALVLDCDKGKVEVDLEPFSDVRYLFQSRWEPNSGVWKWHLILPLADPIVAHATIIGDRRSRAIAWFAEQMQEAIDENPAAASALLHPYMRETADSLAPKTVWNDSPNCIDLDGLLAEMGHRDRRRVSCVEAGTEPQKSKYADVLLKAVTDAGLRNGDVNTKGYPIVCPFDDEHSSRAKPGSSSTLLSRTGYVWCFHDSCRRSSGRRQIDYLQRLNIEFDIQDFPAEAQLMMAEGNTHEVSVAEAGERIERVLREARPYDGTASVVRVSTGAGKTYAVSSFLNRYSSPEFDAETGDVLPGRSAVLAMPTNALLREVEQRIQTEHKVRVGVLAVLNDDGTPACKKHETAKRLQSQGGDVHRLMCHKCEHKEGCPARNGSRKGSGELTITNHTLLPAVVRDLQDSGKIPLIVWDETPPMVESVALKYADLDWLLERFEAEEKPKGLTIEDVGRAWLFDAKYRRCLRPLLEVLRRVRGSTLPDAIEEYSRTRICESNLHAAESMLDPRLERDPGWNSGTPWEHICRVAQEAGRLNVSTFSFDEMREQDQAWVLRAEGIRKLLEAVMDPDAHVKNGVGCLEITRRTEAGSVWKKFGGVVLDATAPLATLSALRPDVTAVDLQVEDADSDESPVCRLLKPSPGLSRTNIKAGKAGKSLSLVAKDIRGERRDLEARLGRTAKLVVFTYQSLIPTLKPLLGEGEWDLWHFGNTRGYNRWFEEAYDAFITVGDPYTNIGIDEALIEYLALSEKEKEFYSVENARAELAQAHGRARDPQQKKGDGERLHLHYGRLPPLGWTANNADILPLDVERAVIDGSDA